MSRVGPQALEGAPLIKNFGHCFTVADFAKNFGHCSTVAEFAKNIGLHKGVSNFRTSWRLRLQQFAQRFPRPILALLVALLLFGPSALLAQATTPSAEHLIVVVGAVGSDEFKTEFSQWSKPWIELSARKNWQLTLIGDQPLPQKNTEAGDQAQTTDLAKLQVAIAAHEKSNSRLWIVLLGHGTYSASAAKFNLVGPDVSAKDLSTWLKPISSPVVVVNCSASSAPFMSELATGQRVLITATRAGSEINFARFGKYLSESINDLASDVDHDLEVSLLEAFLAATARTERFYREDARLTTEHALLDDNGDRVGTSGDFFRGVRPVKAAAKGASVDGEVAKRIMLYSSPEAARLSPELELQRGQIEAQLDKLRASKKELAEADYLNQLEQLMLKLSAVYEAAET